MTDNIFNDGEENGYDKGPLVKLAEAIERGDVDFHTFNYKCDKCGRDAQWEYFIGIPLQNIPCGCGGLLVLQKREI